MRGQIGLFLLAVTMCPVHGASVVSFGATLCGPDQQMTNGKCADKESGKCPAGYYATVIGAATYSAATVQTRQCMNTYDMVEMPDFFYPIYNGVLVGFGATLCGAGAQLENGKCVDWSRGKCPDGAHKTAIGQATFSAATVDNSQCMNTYDIYELPEYLTPIYNGVLVSFGATLCGAGQQMQSGACADIVRGECPENFHDITVNDETLLPRTGGVCAKNYGEYFLVANCADGAQSGGMCAMLCDAGVPYTGVGTCAAYCTHGATVLRTSTGLRIPLYDARQTTPALNVELGADVCYGNLVPGQMAGAINMRGTDGVYYLVD